jgi:uncharacterized protein (TIGR00369 family)
VDDAPRSTGLEQREGAISDLEQTLRTFVDEQTPHNRYLGLRLSSVGPGEATCALPYSAALVGDSDAATLHGGVITALMDVASGAAVCMELGRLRSMATLEMRIDSLRPPTSGQSLSARAHCYRVAGSTAFVRALAYDEDTSGPVAASQGTYMLMDD